MLILRMTFWSVTPVRDYVICRKHLMMVTNDMWRTPHNSDIMDIGWTTPHDYKTTSKGWDHNRPYHRLRRISHLQSHKVFPRIWRLSLSSPPSSSFASCNPPSQHQEYLFISPIANISPLRTIGVTGMGGVGSCHTVGLSKKKFLKKFTKFIISPHHPRPPFQYFF